MTTAPTPCPHDYTHPVRKGRMRYHCRNCDADISLDVLLLAEAELPARPIEPQTWTAEDERDRLKHRAGLL
jgi:hypothetical protein